MSWALVADFSTTCMATGTEAEKNCIALFPLPPPPPPPAFHIARDKPENEAKNCALITNMFCHLRHMVHDLRRKEVCM